MIGPTTGTQAYPQSLEPLPLIGRKACAMRGPRSRAGLMAYPVGPPREAPMPTTRRATGSAPSGPSPPVAVSGHPTPKPITTKTSTKVPMISVTRFQA